MHTLMIDPCQLWSRKKPLVLNHLPNHQSPTTKLLVLSHLPSHQSSPFLPKHRQTHRVLQRPNTSTDRLPGVVNATNLGVPSTTLPLHPACLVTLAGSPHPPHQSPDHARDHVLASTIVAASQVRPQITSSLAGFNIT